MKNPICKYCGKECKLAPSQRNRKTNGKTQCNSCAVTKRRWKTKLELVQHKGGKCERCGWVGHPGGFHFHHKDSSIKKFELNGNGLLLRERWSELEKCELLCSCCHGIEHSNTELLKRMGLI